LRAAFFCAFSGRSESLSLFGAALGASTQSSAIHLLSIFAHEGLDWDMTTVSITS